MDQYDVVIVGSGTGGQTAAYELNENGLSVAVVEKSKHPGGTCALYGCQPKKWFYEVTDAVARAGHLQGKGVVKMPETSWSEIRKQKNRFTSRISGGTVKDLENEGITFLAGNAKFDSPDTLIIDGKPVKSKFYLLASGARPMPLPIAGREHIITSDEFLELERLPESILFVGGGFISFEFAHFAARLGPKNGRIVIMEVSERPLSQFDPEMVDLLVEASQEEGIAVRTHVMIDSVEKKKSGYIVKTKSGEVFEADLVAHGAGRVPDVEALDLKAGGIEYSSKGIAVNRQMMTSNSRVFAVGDCAATIQLARAADYEAHVAARNILANIRHTPAAEIDYRAVPAILFTYPQYGVVGKTEKELKERKIAYRKSFDKNLTWPSYTRIGLKHAAYKILAGTDGKILGAHILSDNAAGLINIFKLAMINDIAADKLYWQNIMTPYPTRESDLIYMLEPFL